MQRRDLLKRSAAGLTILRSGMLRGQTAPSNRLNVALIGVWGRGTAHYNALRNENVVALCDVDWERAAEAFYRIKDAKQYKDFRNMLEEMKDIDACTISTPDHTHAPAAVMAMSLGKHVYVQKPLTHTVAEARLLTTLAREKQVATQMGNQGHCGNGVRDLCEMLWSGAIGEVKECHIWTNRPVWPQGLSRPDIVSSAPETLDWDRWLGPAPYRPFVDKHPVTGNDCYRPFVWRGWWDFGTGAMGDMACHILGAPNLALKLGLPTSVECISKEGVSPFMFPKKSVTKFEFPARGSMPPVTLYWYDGCKETPKINGVPEGELLGDLPVSMRAMKERMAAMGGGQGQGQRQRMCAPPFTGIIGRTFNYGDYLKMKEDPDARVPPPDGSLFIGDKGMITTGTYGEQTRHIPVAKMQDYRFPQPLLTRSPGHYRDWIRACKGGEPACSNLDVAAPFVEWMLLGVIALRVEGKLMYDGAKMRFTNNNEANQYLKPTFRKGWSFA